MSRSKSIERWCEMDSVERFRTRWRRWLGNKTVAGKPYWVTLLDSEWSTWAKSVCQNHEIEYVIEWRPASVKRMFSTCIDIATMEELVALDGIYASDMVSRLGG